MHIFFKYPPRLVKLCLSWFVFPIFMIIYLMQIVYRPLPRASQAVEYGGVESVERFFFVDGDDFFFFGNGYYQAFTRFIQ